MSLREGATMGDCRHTTGCGYLHRLAAAVFLAVATILGTAFLAGAVASAAPLPGGYQATHAIAPIPTTTTLTTTPALPVPLGTQVTLTARVIPQSATGTVQFKDGDNNLGKPVIVTDGTAEGTSKQLAAGAHQLTAAFAPADPAAYTASMSEPRPFTVLVPAGPVDTNTTLATSAASPALQGSLVTLTATVTPPEAAGTVQFKDGAMSLGGPVTVTNGTASTTMLISSAGQRQLTAVFTPANQAKFNPSISAVLSLNVIPLSQAVTPQAQASGQSLDGSVIANDQGGTVADLDIGGLTDGREGGGLGVNVGGVRVLDGGNVRGSGGLTLLPGSNLTILRDRDNEGLLSSLLHALL